MGERRMLELAFQGHQLDLPGDAAGMRIHKADPLIGSDLFGHLGRQLEKKRKIQPLVGGEQILIGIRSGQAQPDCQGMQHMPGYAIILAVRVAVPDHQSLVQTLPAVAGTLDGVLQFVNGAFRFILDGPHHITDRDHANDTCLGNHR